MKPEDGNNGYSATVYKGPCAKAYPTEAEYTIRPPTGDYPTESSLLLHQNMRKKLRKCQEIIKGRSLLVDLLTIFFGIGTWVSVNGTFIQLPLLVEVAPEYWSLPSYLSVVVQIGNFGPLVYTILQKITSDKLNESAVIYFLLGLGTISSILTAFLYDRTAVIAGQEHSVALFVFTFLNSLTACTSSVLFMPYMGRFKEIYLVTYLTGEGLSGLLPSVVALIQGVGGQSQCVLNQTESGSIWVKQTSPPRFGTMEFFLFVFFMMLCSCVGFTLLDRLKSAKKQYADVTVLSGNTYVYEKNQEEGKPNAVVEELPQISSCQYKWMLFLICVVSFFANGMFNSIQSYSTLPYGSQAYHLTTTLSVIANPVACFLAVFLPHTSLKSILSLSSVAAVFTCYVFVTAIMSPNPPLKDSPAGGALVIILWTLLIGLISYVKLSITSVMRAQGGKSLVWTGALTQIGSAVGSVIIFSLINFTTSFTAFEEKCGEQ